MLTELGHLDDACTHEHDSLQASDSSHAGESAISSYFGRRDSIREMLDEAREEYERRLEEELIASKSAAELEGMALDDELQAVGIKCAVDLMMEYISELCADESARTSEACKIVRCYVVSGSYYQTVGQLQSRCHRLRRAADRAWEIEEREAAEIAGEPLPKKRRANRTTPDAVPETPAEKRARLYAARMQAAAAL